MPDVLASVGNGPQQHRAAGGPAHVRVVVLAVEIFERRRFEDGPQFGLEARPVLPQRFEAVAAGAELTLPLPEVGPSREVVQHIPFDIRVRVGGKDEEAVGALGLRLPVQPLAIEVAEEVPEIVGGAAIEAEVDRSFGKHGESDHKTVDTCRLRRSKHRYNRGGSKGSVAMVTGTSAPFVGRAAELAAVESALERARGGDGCLVLLGGEAGIGKSRLLEETRGHARSLGFGVIEGACFPFDSTIPLSPFVDLVRSALAEPALAAVEHPATGLAALSSLLPELAAASDVGSEQDKQQLFRGVTEFLYRCATHDPVLVVIEDLHWADEVSLELLLLLARRASGRQLLLMASYRSDEQGEALAGLVAQLARTRLAELVELPPLTAAQTAELVTQLQGGHHLRSDLLDELHTLTEGNPLFIEEVVKSLGAASRSLRQDAGATTLPFAVLQAPRSVRESVRRRLSVLSEPACRVLTVAAVAGRRFDFEVLELATGIDEQGLIALLRELVDADMVREESPDRFAFRHALTRQAVVGNLLGRERQQLHDRIASALAGLPGRTARDPSDLAYHCFEAARWEEAAQYARIAGDRAMVMFSPRAAAQQFARAERALRELGREPGWELVWSNARANDTLGDFDAAKAEYDRAVSIARGSGDRRQEWQALIDLGLLWAGRDYQRARRSFESALELARVIDNPALLARTLNRLGNVAVNEERLEDAFGLHREALAIAARLGDQQQVAECHDLMGMASFQAGELPRAESHYEQAIAAFRQAGERYGLSSALAVRALCAGANLTETEVDSARTAEDQRSDVEEALRLAEESGWRAGEAFALAVLSWVLTPRGDYAEAFRAGERALAIAEDIEHRQWTAAGCCALGRLFAEVLDMEHAREYLERGYALAHELASPLWLCNIGGSLVEVYAAGEDFERARTVLAEVEETIGTRPTLHGRTAMASKVAVELAAGDAAAALHTLELLCPGDNDEARRVPLLARLRAEALLGLGHIGQAEEFAVAARNAAEARQRPGQAWRSELVLARIHAAAGRRPQSREAYRAVRTLAAQLATRIEPEPLRESFRLHVEALLPERPPTELQAARIEYGGLTAREREVATLVAQGLTNREIARRLVVSERTAEAHVSNLLHKLDFSSRSQVGVWAAEKGLLD